MAFKLPTVSYGDAVQGRHVLIDADVIAYLGSQGCDEMPLNAALAKMKQRWNQVLVETRAESYTGFLTGKNNFRDSIATLQRYKGNRYDKFGNRIKPQPIWLQECRQELIEVYGCILCEGQEADDALGIESARRSPGDAEHPTTIISSIDKDLGINPGCHHNMTSGLMTWVDREGAIWIDEKIHKVTGKTVKKFRGNGMHFFWAQMLMGDNADWIKGLPKVGDKPKAEFSIPRKGNCGEMTAWAILKDAVTEEDMQDRVWFCYKDYWMSHSYKHWRTDREFPAGIITAKKQFIEQGRLLWMRREEGELWNPPFPLT